MFVNQIDTETARRKMEELNVLQDGQARAFSRLRSNRSVLSEFIDVLFFKISYGIIGKMK